MCLDLHVRLLYNIVVRVIPNFIVLNFHTYLYLVYFPTGNKLVS